jgi:nucleoside 2-deoxyribosyltransferase
MPARALVIGPDSLRTDGIAVVDRQLARVRAARVDAESIPATASLEGAASALRSCDIVIANMSPVRGVSADAGTILLIGMARALQKPVFGWSDAAATTYSERVLHFGLTAPAELIEQYDAWELDDTESSDRAILVAALAAPLSTSFDGALELALQALAETGP